jgi:HlyD family secretion protein
MSVKQMTETEPKASTSQPDQSGSADKAPVILDDATKSKLPASLPVRYSPPTRKRWARLAAILALVIVATGGGAYWWMQNQSQLPAGIVAGNGRIEADEIDIATKFAGRVAEIMVQEGDMVRAGQVLARMDSKDLEASLGRAEAQVLQAQEAVDEARGMQEQLRTQVALARQQLDRTTYLVQRGNATRELLDQRQQQMNANTAALNAATARVAQAEFALAAVRKEVELYKINIADNTLVAPRDGRVQYRIANIGEVLPAGGKVATMIDVASVYMDIYLPTLEAGRVEIGTDARIVLDAYADVVIPAKASFIANQSQFTPKTVETQTERDRLMFRIRVRVDPELLRAHAQSVRSGLPGVAFVRLDRNVEWPARLQRTIGQ